MKKLFFLSLACSFIFGGGYKIPEQSGDSVAMSAANIAKSFGADASYYNPANMAFLDDSRHLVEIGGTVIYLKKSKYIPDEPTYPTESSKDFGIVVPNLHFVSPAYFPNLRFGLSFVVPAGMTMRWEDGFLSRSFAKEFQLKVFELNPTMSYQISDEVAFGFGLRGVYTKGVVKNYVGLPNQFKASREITGDSLDFGYNLALAIKPNDDLNFAVTYRSNVDLTVKGTADILVALNNGNFHYHGDVNTQIPLPATLNLAAAYTLNKTTFLATYERIFWSKFKDIDFDYKGDVPEDFDLPVAKNWRNTSAYRFAISHELNDKIRLMAGFAYDESVSKDEFVGFELPESKAYLYSGGINYKFSENLQTSFSYLYQDRQTRPTQNQHQGGLEGKFKNGDVQLFNLSLKYAF